MQRIRKDWFLAMLVTALVVIVSTNVLGAETRIKVAKPVADEAYGTSAITWSPKVTYSQLVLTVARPDGTVFKKTFTDDTIPAVSLRTLCGRHQCNGSYTYDLRVIPDSTAQVRGSEEMGGDPASSLSALTQTGHFTVSKGAIVLPNGTEDSSVKDVVHADDVIITGSQCVGFDCLTDGTEAFGFDTIKLKENNLQIFFDDTSATVGFPANDWRIVTNDSGSGGASYFRIDDATAATTPFKIMAAAPNNSIFVSSVGRLGIKTATPALNLHIVHGDTPAIRLEQDNSSGWTPQVWDMAGNESNFFIRDVTNGSKLPFRIQPNTPSSTLTLKADGKVGIGTWSPAYPLDVVTTGVNSSIAITRTDGATNFINATDSFADFGSITPHPLRLMVNSAWKARFNDDGSLDMVSGAKCSAGGVWTNASSIKLKENIQSLSTDEAMSTLIRLSPVKYNYKVDKTDKHVGFIAEESPDLVTTQDKKGMSPMDVVAVLTKVVQEQQKTIDELKSKIEKLEKPSSK